MELYKGRGRDNVNNGKNDSKDCQNGKIDNSQMVHNTNERHKKILCHFSIWHPK